MPGITVETIKAEASPEAAAAITVLQEGFNALSDDIAAVCVESQLSRRALDILAEALLYAARSLAKDGPV